MADCPKCRHHLKLTDWKQKCPYCGANVVLYDLQERLMQDADKAEVQYYEYSKKVDRVKASFVGSRLAILRIVVSLLPIAALFAPLFRNAPPKNGSSDVLSFDILKLYDLFGKNDPTALLKTMWNAGKDGRMFVCAVACLALSLVFLLVHFLFLFLSCSPRGRLRNYTFCALTLGFGLAFTVLLLAQPDGLPYSVWPDWGAAVYPALTAIVFIVDIAAFIQGIPIRHRQCYVGGIPIEEYFKMVEAGVPPEELRQEMYRRLRAQQMEKEAQVEAETHKTAHTETNGKTGGDEA